MYEFVHTKLGFCFWDIPALIVLIAIIAIFVVHVIRQKDVKTSLKTNSQTRWLRKRQLKMQRKEQLNKVKA